MNFLSCDRALVSDAIANPSNAKANTKFETSDLIVRGKEFSSNSLIVWTLYNTSKDGESIAWITSAIGRPVDGRWVFHEIILFNNTQSKSLALLNNSIGLVKSTVGNEPDYIWLLK